VDLISDAVETISDTVWGLSDSNLGWDTILTEVFDALLSPFK
jgi:hypothetical protein